MTGRGPQVSGHSRRGAIATLVGGTLAGGIFAGSAGPARADSATLSDEVFFAGLAYLADHDDVARVLPCTLQQISGDNGAGFNRMLSQLAAQAPCQVRINTDGLGKLAPGKTAYVMALAVDHEATTIEDTRDGYKLRCELWGQILVFDFKSRAIVSSLPLIVAYNDLLPSAPTDEDIAAGYRKLLFDSGPGFLQAEFVAKLAGKVMPGTSTRSIRVTSATLADLATQQVADNHMDPTGKFAGQMASRFTGRLSANQKICVLPARASEAIGNTMAARLSNGSVYQLTIPKPDYEISLRLDGFKSKLVTDVPAGKGYVYGAFVTVAVTEPLSHTVFFNQQVRHGENRTQPATAGEIVDAPVFEDVLEVLFEQFTTAIDPLDEKWAQQNILPANSAVAALKSLRGVIQLCR